MATSIASAFMAKLLAPLPADEEQADTKQFRKEIDGDISLAWRQGMERVRMAEALQTVAWGAFKASGERRVSDPTPFALGHREAVERRVAWQHQQCLLLAPRPIDMRWKKRVHRYSSPIPDDVAAAIARDEARFAEGR